jgi:endonuclease/exonuclease/phosphatase family metal-dependent hydrolase
MIRSRRTTVVLLLITAIFAVALIVRAPASLSKSKRTLRVMTYNIHVGVGMDKKLDLQRIADVIKKEKPDLVGLQEVDRGVTRTEGKDEIAELAQLTSMHFAFAHNIDYQGGQYGVAVLSRFPIERIEHRKYENKRVAERRGMLRAEMKVGGRTVNFVTTHLDYQYADSRLFETEQLLSFLAEIKGPLIVAGDFNDLPVGDSYKLMVNQFEDAWITSRAKGDGLSYPSDKPVKRIDFIFTRVPAAVKAKRAWVVNTLASDHLPVVVEVEIR